MFASPARAEQGFMPDKGAKSVFFQQACKTWVLFFKGVTIFFAEASFNA